MICPDTWKYVTPNTSVSYKINDLSEDVQTNLNKKISSHYFNKLVSGTLNIITKNTQVDENACECCPGGGQS